MNFPVISTWWLQRLSGGLFCVGGLFTATVLAQPSSPTAPEQASAEIGSLAKCAVRVKPSYSALAFDERAQGLVVVHIELDAQGMPTAATVQSNSAAGKFYGDELALASREAALKFRCAAIGSPYVIRQEFDFKPLRDNRSQHCATRVSPRYPPAALKAGVSARLMVRISVGAGGKPTDAQIKSNDATTSPSGAAFAQSFEAPAMEAAMRYRCAAAAQPYLIEQSMNFISAY